MEDDEYLFNEQIKKHKYSCLINKKINSCLKINEKEEL